MKLIDNPIFRYGMRRHAKRWYLLPAMTAVFNVLLVVLLLYNPSGDLGGEAGDVYMLNFLLMSGALANLVLPGYAPRTMTSEFEQQTFEPLIVARLTRGDIVLGKLAIVTVPFLAGYALAIPCALFAAIVFAIPVWWILCAFGWLTVLTIANGMVGLWAGALMKRTISAGLLSYAIAVILIPAASLAVSYLMLYNIDPRGSINGQELVCFWFVYATHMAILTIAAVFARFGLAKELDKYSARY